MTRKFTQRHYIAVADALVKAYQHPALAIGHKGMSTEAERHGARVGIGLVTSEFVRVFSEDSERFDFEKFQKYISDRKGLA